MNVHLIDGTYELFRAFYGAPSSVNKAKREVGATRSMLRSLAAMLREPEVTHIAVAFDTVIESFRNQLFAGYKTGEGIDPDLHSQFELAERMTRALGIVTWSMIEFEADDAIATAAARFADADGVEQVRICSPDKDFGQCLRGDKVVLFSSKDKRITNADAMRARLGVGPGQVAAWLALVGDTADGIPGIERWGEKSAATVLNRYLSIVQIPEHARQWDIPVRGKDALAASLNASRKDAELYEQLATLRLDVPLKESLADLEWRGVDMPALEALCDEVNAPDVLKRMRSE